MKPKKEYVLTLLVICFLSVFSCSLLTSCTQSNVDEISVIFDTDANNELDDQHALAYLLNNQNTFDVVGVTVNATYNGGEVYSHYEEAKRVMQLCDMFLEIPLILGAEGDFTQIKKQIDQLDFDGHQATDFIIRKAQEIKDDKLVVLAVGKLTNVALAVLKEPSITNKIKVVWLGSNYPDPGEYNLENDIDALNFLLSTDVEFEIAVCRYGKDSGTDAVKVTQKNILENFKGKGMRVVPVEGRHGGVYTTFGDYSVSLFEHADYYGDPPSRSLFDMAAVAIVKDSTLASSKQIPAPEYLNSQWIDQPNNDRKIKVWEYFNRDEILKDFYNSFQVNN